MNVLLGITGSVAAIYTDKLIQLLNYNGHDVKLIPTTASKHFFDYEKYERDHTISVITDKDEWVHGGYVKDDPVPHIDLGEWADMLIIAPLSANTLAKMANGMADNLLTCIVRAWIKHKPIIVAPAMNTRMWYSDFTQEHLERMKKIGWLFVVDPREAELACGTRGVGAMAFHQTIMETIVEYQRQLERLNNCATF